ncbi:MAG: type II secretion system F family protein, partial [Novosphingobium sp.]
MSWQMLLIVAGVTGELALAVILLAGRSDAKASQRRLQAVRFRHSDSAKDKVEAQYRKAVAARKPRVHQVAGSGGRGEALALRLRRTGKKWTIQQYLYASIGLTLGIALLAYLKTGAGMLSLGLGVLVGAGLPHMVVNQFIKRRANNFITRFPDAIELLVRGLRSGLPVTETLGIVAGEVPGPVGEEFKLVSERMRIGRPM